MKNALSLLAVLCLFGIKANAAEIRAESLDLTAEQSQKLAVMQEQLKAEIQPIWEEVESGRNRIIEIEKQYFQAFAKISGVFSCAGKTKNALVIV